jgi:type VI protein secretion system component Hcp
MKYSGGIEGGYKSSGSKLAGDAGLTADSHHDGWSEVYSFNYTLDDSRSSSIEITKPADKASSLLYQRYLQCLFAKAVSGSALEEHVIEEINVELLRREDGAISSFANYRFKECRILSYGMSREASSDEPPEEKLTIAFNEMYMKYSTPSKVVASFDWDFKGNNA